MRRGGKSNLLRWLLPCRQCCSKTNSRSHIVPSLLIFQTCPITESCMDLGRAAMHWPDCFFVPKECFLSNKPISLAPSPQTQRSSHYRSVSLSPTLSLSLYGTCSAARQVAFSFTNFHFSFYLGSLSCGRSLNFSQ